MYGPSAPPLPHKGRQAAQPRGPGGEQWDSSSPRPRPEGQVQTTSPPCEAVLQLKGEPRNRATKEPGRFLSAAFFFFFAVAVLQKERDPGMACEQEVVADDPGGGLIFQGLPRVSRLSRPCAFHLKFPQLQNRSAGF